LKLYIVFLLFLVSLGVVATPSKIIVYFLSPGVATSLYQQNLTLGRTLAANDVNCEPMGDYCFHPQYGIVEDNRVSKQKEMKKKLDYIHSQDANLINCDKGNYFDLYCGKGRAVKKNPPTELWIDISSSMNRVDPMGKTDYCERRHFASYIRDKCGSNIGLSTFDTAIQTAYDSRSFCISAGTNNGERLVAWIKRSTAKTLMIVTDVDEYHGVFREYLDQRGAKLEGLGVKGLTNKDLQKLHSKVSTYCAK
jgi:hypothetical protein